MTISILQCPLPYVERLERRDVVDIRLVVIHCTELPDLATARVWGEREIYPDTNTGNSGHFYIDRDGTIEQWVAVNRTAHHVRGFNTTSLGIELVNNGRYPYWFNSDHQEMTEPYPHEQLDAVMSCLNWLDGQLPGLTLIAGHADLDTAQQPAADNPGIKIYRKRDPGPRFPWYELLSGIKLSRITSYVAYQNMD